MVEYIEINGEKHPIIVNFFVIGEFQRDTGLSFSSLSDLENNLYLVEPLLWFSLKAGYLITKQEMKIIREDMPILLSVNEVYTDFINIISKFFPVSDALNSSKKKKN